MKNTLQLINIADILPQDDSFPSKAANQIFLSNLTDFVIPPLLIAISFVIFALIKGNKKYKERKILPWIVLCAGILTAVLIWAIL